MTENQGSVTVGTKSFAAMMAASLDRQIGASRVVKPNGKYWLNAEEFAESLGLSRPRMDNKIAEWVKAGLLEVFEGRNDKNRLIRYYREKNRNGSKRRE